MPITALPRATVQLLGSSQVLTTPTSLIKELIDNALDAKASSVDVILSKNTLDKLEVRDNGHGISSKDFDCLGKRGHTSKLRTFEELKFIGGNSLGFRGEALASAIQLGEVCVTTKTEGEVVATCLKLKAPGIVDMRTHTSHPVGTTVSVKNFMDKLPVRKKTFEQGAPKTLAKINQLLRSYALARPFIRFTLKVSGVSKSIFSFAPRRRDGIKESISLVIGRDAAMECIEKSLSCAEAQTRLSSIQKNSSSNDADSHADVELYAINAFLPKPNADLTKIGAGQYLSIDARPVSHEKGTMRKIVALFKKYIRQAFDDTSEKIKNPFIRLDIKCPVGSYDANVEPAKDDVLFGNEYAVLELVEKLFKDVYGALNNVSVDSSFSKSLAKDVGNFELLLARDPETAESSLREIPEEPLPIRENFLPSPESSSVHRRSLDFAPNIQTSSLIASSMEAPKGSTTILSEPRNEQFSSSQRSSGFKMFQELTGGVAVGTHCDRPKESFRPPLDQTLDRGVSGNSLNPWLIAKMNAPLSCNQQPPDFRPLRTFNQPLLETVNSSRKSPDPLNESHKFAPPLVHLRQPFHRDDAHDFQPPVFRRYSASSIRPQFEEELFVVDKIQHTPRKLGSDFVSARIAAEKALPSPPRTASRMYTQGRGPKKPFVSPLITTAKHVTQSDNVVQTTLFGSNVRPRRQSEGNQDMLNSQTEKDLSWAMEFEQRKQEATRRRREELRAAAMKVSLSSSSDSTQSSPHKNRYNAAIATLEARGLRDDLKNPPPEPGAPFKTTLPDTDPRAYLMKRQKPFATMKYAHDQTMIMRTKSFKLPLESIPQDGHVHNLVYHMCIDTVKMQAAIKILAEEDVYIYRGAEYVGLVNKTVEEPSVKRKLQKVIDTWVGSGDEQKYEVEYNFGNLLMS